MAVHLLDRIDRALRDKDVRVDPEAFEQFALDHLASAFPGLTPIPGGSDGGRDGDAPDSQGGPPGRLLVTTARTLEGIRSNMRRGLASLEANGEPVNTIVLVNLGEPSARQVVGLERSAAQFGVAKVWSFPRRWVRDQLRRDGEWREKLLGLPGDPIGVASEPPELSTTPWAQVPLIGRDHDLTRLREEGAGDIVLSGPPGCGKTRLLAELEGVVFVERDVRIQVVLDDLRALSPSTVVIDDAGARRSVVRQILTARRQEPDLLKFRLIVVCWPDEIDHLLDDLPGASDLALDLLEVGEIDAILRSVGVTGITARAEILKQAAGRPGWALLLVETLRAPKPGADLLSGRALLAEVSRYLRVRGIDTAGDVLAMIGLLGGISQTEQARLAAELGLQASELRRLLLTAARSGIVDVTSRWARTGTQRHYFVRPRVLAASLAAERLIASDFPPVDLYDLSDRWPDRRVEVASAATEAVGLGVTSARQLAKDLVDTVLSEVDGPRSSAGLELAMSFGHLDRAAAAHILATVRPAFDLLRQGEGDSSYLTSPFTDLATALLGWQLPEAAEMVLDALLLHPRLESDFPNGPLQGLEQTLTHIHPEIEVDPTLPAFFAVAAGNWLDRDSNDDRRWTIWAHACAGALHPTRQGTYTDPGSPMTVTMFGRGLDEVEVKIVTEQVWPSVQRRLAGAPTAAVATIVSAIGTWLWSAKGQLSVAPPAAPHMAPLIIDAGATMLVGAVPAAEMHPGLAAKVNSIAREHGVDAHAEVRGELGDLLSQLTRDDARSERWERSSTVVTNAVEGWWNRRPDEVIATLLDLRNQLNAAGVSWPPAARIASDVIAPNCKNPSEWFAAALGRGFLPEGVAFAAEAMQRGELTGDLVERAMTADRARWTLISLVLEADPPSPELVDVVVRLLKPTDLSALEHLVMDQPEADVIASILDHDDPAVAAAMAVAMTGDSLIEEEEWAPPPGRLAAWSQASGYAGDLLPELAHDRAGRFYRCLARRSPAVLVRSAADLASDEHGRPRMPHEMCEGLAALPANEKIELLRLVRGRPGRQRIIRGVVGSDTTWISEAFDSDAITPDEVIDGIDGLGESPALEELAPILIPAGASAARLAQTAMFGTGFGEESAVNQNHVDRFAEMMTSSDPSIAAVGRAGVEIFTRLAEDARRKERRARIRGDW